MELYPLTIKEAASKLSQGGITSVELTEAIFDRIKAVESKVGAYITLCEEKALQMAKISDERRKVGKTLSQLDGIPIAVKDLFLTKGVRTTAGSKILENFIPIYESTVTKKLWEAGAVLIGKTNLDEFAMGSSTETSAYKTATAPTKLQIERNYEITNNTTMNSATATRNPWDFERVPGGSSGGSAAAVAADLCMAAIGTDTGGSIRQPASHCGITGLKPSYGRVSRYGTIAMASSLDQAGPMTKTVEDAAILLETISGYDKYDSTSSTKEVPNYLKAINNQQLAISNLRIGVPDEFFAEGLEKDVEDIVRSGIRELGKLGAEIVPVSLKSVHYALAVYYILMPAEVSSNLARYDGIRYGHSVLKSGLASRFEIRDSNLSISDVYTKSRAEGFGAEAKRRIMLGSYVLSAGYYDAYYKKAQKVRTLIKEEFDKIFNQVHLLAAPVTPTPAFKMGEKVSNPLSMYLSDIMTVPANPAGLPAMSVPAGFVKRENKDLPVGLQLIGPMWSEETLLSTGHAFQQVTEWHRRKPVL